MAVSSVIDPPCPNFDSGPYSRHGTHRQLLGRLASFDCQWRHERHSASESGYRGLLGNTTPAKVRKSGLLYIQQILHDQRGALSQQSRDFAVAVDAYIEKKLTE
jgi:hypothetical protein